MGYRRPMNTAAALHPIKIYFYIYYVCFTYARVCGAPHSDSQRWSCTHSGTTHQRIAPLATLADTL